MCRAAMGKLLDGTVFMVSDRAIFRETPAAEGTGMAALYRFARLQAKQGCGYFTARAAVDRLVVMRNNRPVAVISGIDADQPGALPGGRAAGSGRASKNFCGRHCCFR